MWRGLRADVLGPIAHPGTLGHQRPEGGAVRAAGGIVEVRQSEVVAVLVDENADTAVFGLDGVLADPVVAAADLAAARRVECRSGRSDALVEGIPAVAPDRGLTQRTASGLFAFPGVDRLERVDVAVRLVEIAVTVVVVAIPDIELTEVRVDLRRALAGRDLRVVPGVHRILQEVPHSVGPCAWRDVHQVVIVRRRVPGHRDPVGHVAVHRVAAGRLFDVEVPHRVRARRFVEQDVDEVVPAEIRDPERGVVHAAIRLRDRVVLQVRELAQHRPQRALPFP